MRSNVKKVKAVRLGIHSEGQEKAVMAVREVELRKLETKQKRGWRRRYI